MSGAFLNSMISDLLGDLRDPEFVKHLVWQLATLVVALAVAWGSARWMRRRIRRQRALGSSSGANLPAHAAQLPGVLAPWLAWLILESSARIATDLHERSNLLRIASVLLLAMGALRVVGYAVARVFSPGAWVAMAQRVLTAVVLVGVLLHVTGFLPEVLGALEIPIYKSADMPAPVTLLQLIRDGFLVFVALIAALWAGAALDARLMRVDSIDASLRVALARFARAVLIVIAVLISMNAVGIPLGVLSVFGGALGVGLGLGLQRIASNYVSGFIILLDRSLRIGDLITVDKYYGAVTQIRTRYTVIKALDGTEAIIPNELLVSGAVTNHSYTSREARVALKVTIAAESDLDGALQILTEAAASQERVLADPAPLATLNAFGPDGLELELGFWILDPEAGTGLIKSDINRHIHEEFKKAGILLAAPQREVRVFSPEPIKIEALPLENRQSVPK